MGITHRDLKLENILLVSSEEPTRVKLSDFNHSQMLGPNEEGTDYFGQIQYLAPEMIKQEPYLKNIDVWGLGVIYYYLLSGHFPFKDNNHEDTAKRIIQDQVNVQGAP